MTLPPVHSSAFYEALVSSCHDVIVTEAMDGTITSYNNAAERMYGRNAEDAIGRPVAEIHPTSQSAPMLEARMAARRGEEVPAIELTRATSKGLLQISVRFSPIFSEQGEVVGITSIVRDISHRAEATAEFELRARQQAAVAWFGQRALESTSLEELMQSAVDLVARALGVGFVKLLTVSADKSALVLSAGTGWRPELYGTAVAEISRRSPAGLALLGGVPIIITDLRTGDPFPPPSFLHDHGIVSGISVVIHGPDQPFGVLGAHSATERSFTVDDLHFLEAVTNILGTALSRFRNLDLLEQRVAERTRELRVLLDISHDTAATLELGPLVGLILDRIKGLVDYTGAALYVLDESGEALTLVRYQGPIPHDQLNYRWTLESRDHARATIETGRPVIINDVFGDDPLAESLRRNAIRDLGAVRDDFGSWMSVPMKLGDRVTGMLAVEIDQINCYTDHHAELLMAVADQAAVAVENARLYGQARGLAALEERQKLARELHDSVSQALFGIGLGARTARTLLDRDPAR
ncbi:MAG: GAF domain-containing protein, partial [Chloroflexota bacterium]|nr:GAF domain-containing protein [Chloroflexota bacterium]